MSTSTNPTTGAEQSRARYPDVEGFVERDGVRVFWERYGEGSHPSSSFAEELTRPVDYLPVEADGASRAARLLADLF